MAANFPACFSCLLLSARKVLMLILWLEVIEDQAETCVVSAKACVVLAACGALNRTKKLNYTQL